MQKDHLYENKRLFIKKDNYQIAVACRVFDFQNIRIIEYEKLNKSSISKIEIFHIWSNLKRSSCIGIIIKKKYKTLSFKESNWEIQNP